MRRSSLLAWLLAFFLGMVLFKPGLADAQPSTPDSTVRKTQPLIEVLTGLNKSRGIFFLFSRGSLAGTPVDPPILSPGASIEKILTQVLRKSGLRYKKVDERTFVILEKRPTAADSTFAPAVSELSPAPAGETRRGFVSGHVLASDGRNLQGVSITLGHTHTGTTTDLAGYFEIGASGEDTLLFSFVGYRTKKLAADKLPPEGIILDPSDQPLTEVLITAMGIRKQERSLGFAT
ncbi:MAG TPA: carboxypeptidase-like regulatory domain-containing protein, partial [Puia sp.]|nr:carboxypeptidase-like regulatory domain-containing protein [Puia sp.]